MKYSRQFSSEYTKCLFLHVLKHNSLFVFYLAFLSRIFAINTTTGEGRGSSKSASVYLPNSETILLAKLFLSEYAASILHDQSGRVDSRYLVDGPQAL